MSKHVLITGAGGFIGKALRQHLAQDHNYEVLGLSRSSDPTCEALNLLDREKLKKKITSFKPDVIFHLAGGRFGTPVQIVEKNILTTISLLETIYNLRGLHPRVIIIGSAAEYGEVSAGNAPINEKSPTNPLGLYGWVKLIQSKIALQYTASGQDILIARLFNIIGPGIPQDMSLGRFTQEILLSSKSFKVDNLSGTRDFLDIRDICEALVILSKKGRPKEIYNICSQKGIVMRDLLNRMIELSGNEKIRFTENKLASPGVQFAVGSVVKFQELSGWKPKYSLDQSIRDMLMKAPA